MVLHIRCQHWLNHRVWCGLCAGATKVCFMHCNGTCQSAPLCSAAPPNARLMLPRQAWQPCGLAYRADSCKSTCGDVLHLLIPSRFRISLEVTSQLLGRLLSMSSPASTADPCVGSTSPMASQRSGGDLCPRVPFPPRLWPREDPGNLELGGRGRTWGQGG